MGKLSAILLAFSLSACAVDGGCGHITMPPAQYLNQKVAARDIPLHGKFVANYCAGLGVKTNEKGPVTACTGRDALGWYHVLPDDADPSLTVCYKIHETAHLPPNPWPWDHPGGVYQ